jgi:hypothetical protein
VGSRERDRKELQRLERICLAEAQRSTMELERVGLLKVAADCRQALDQLANTRST